MPEIVLRTTKSYLGSVGGQLTKFRRGVSVDVPEGDYHDLIRTGFFSDPHRHCDPVHPRRLGAIPNGQIVPVIRDVGMGDVLMAAIPLKFLAEKFRGRLRFVYAVASPFVPLFSDASWGVEKVVSIPSMRGNYPWSVDLRAYVEGHETARSQDRTDIFSKYLLGSPTPNYDFPTRATKRWKDRGREIGSLRSGRPTIIYTPRASQMMRSWGLEYHRRFIDIATSHGWQVVIVDQPRKQQERKSLGDGPLVRDLRGKITVEELGYLVAAADVVLTPDTGNLHLGEALQTRTVAYFTTVDPRLRVGHYKFTRALYPDGQLPCLNCTYTPTCKESHPMPCARLTTPERAWREVEWTMDHAPPFAPYAWQGAENQEHAETEELFIG